MASEKNCSASGWWYLTCGRASVSVAVCLFSPFCGGCHLPVLRAGAPCLFSWLCLTQARANSNGSATRSVTADYYDSFP